MQAVPVRPVLLAVCALALLAACSRPAAPRPEPAPAPVPVPAPTPAPPPPAPPPELPGALRVLVENQTAARPQAGLDRADVIYEVEAEGGITRFLAAFYSKAAARIGPVRSARWYFVDIAKAYGAPYAHAGGNADALDTIARDRAFPDVDEIHGVNSGYFWRSKDRQPPHNLYTSTDLLLQAAKARNYKAVPLPAWPTGAPPAAGSTVPDLTLNFHPTESLVRWHWDGSRYQRFINGAPHLVEGQVPLAADNVIVLATEVRVVDIKPDYQRWPCGSRARAMPTSCGTADSGGVAGARTPPPTPSSLPLAALPSPSAPAPSGSRSCPATASSTRPRQGKARSLAKIGGRGCGEGGRE